MTPQRLNPEEVFEDGYTDAFVGRFHGRGVEVKYKRDRAARDVGFHLTAPGSLELSNVKVWFQLKGIHRETLNAEKLGSMTKVAVSLDVDDIKKWYAAPEAVYVVIYLEALDEFIGDDIRDLVDESFADHHGTFTSKMDGLGKTLSLKIDTSSIIDAARIEGMLRHKSMRVDGPSWRGIPLGHRFDPLRSELAVLDPPLFVDLVQALLTAHGFVIGQYLDASSLLKGVEDGTDEAYLSIGTMHSRYEWPFSLSVEFGVSPDSDYRDEGQMMSVQGSTALFVHSHFGGHAQPATKAPAILQTIRDAGIGRVLAIGNAGESLLMASYRSLFSDLFELPLGGGALAYSILTAPRVFAEFEDRLVWRFVNYLWDDPDRLRVQLAPPDEK
jgi:hypothetical protein